MIPRFEVIDIGPAPNPHPATARSITTREIATVNDHDHWNGRQVQIGGIGRMEVLATDRHNHRPPWNAGETIVITCRKV
ncbi:hypothetical protein [Azospirillum sp. TSO5]|uniref:hypothetical protein n=1 Tax=Azospirillum sp. TSO5 TaxID=716760 RepID=UPI000D61B679|nr:hypothetical protein [Azospirillum sp. TSO5]PWC98046.1 hypothetical protein TSO5_03325 [Azospirillum sp. TSO5]